MWDYLENYATQVGMWRIPNLTESDTFSEICWILKSNHVRFEIYVSVQLYNYKFE